MDSASGLGGYVLCPVPQAENWIDTCKEEVRIFYDGQALCKDNWTSLHN